MCFARPLTPFAAYFAVLACIVPHDPEPVINIFLASLQLQNGISLPFREMLGKLHEI